MIDHRLPAEPRRWYWPLELGRWGTWSLYLAPLCFSVGIAYYPATRRFAGCTSVGLWPFVLCSSPGRG